LAIILLELGRAPLELAPEFLERSNRRWIVDGSDQPEAFPRQVTQRLDVCHGVHMNGRRYGQKYAPAMARI
jgi:hypothetical protein